MRPLNTRERRIQFLRFLALFLLAVLPIVVLVWLQGRVDHVENDFLRSKYAKNKAQGEVSAAYEGKLSAMEKQARDLRTFVVQKSGAMEKFKCEEQGELDDKVGSLVSARDEFRLQASTANLNDSIVLLIADHYQAVSSKFISVYEKACADRETAEGLMKELQDKLKKAEEDLRDSEDRLLQYKQLR